MTKWFKPTKHTGWRKFQAADVRRRKLFASTSKIMTRAHRYLQAGRRIQALANVTKDPETAKKAKADAEYFFNKLKGER